MTTNCLAVLINCKYEPRIIVILLAIIRLAICFLPQTGYLHPDEFFQSPELVARGYFNSRIQPVWEFQTDKPIRCMLIPTILNNLAFKFATLLQTKPSAYLLIAAPKLAYTSISFIVDFCLYKLCQYYSSRGLWYLPVSIIFQSSFVCLGCLTRTLSNTPEVVLFALLLVVVCQTIRPRFRILFVTPNRSTPINERVKGFTQIRSSILMGILITLGTFNRPTFLCFAFMPSIYWFSESLKRNSYDLRLTIQRVLVPLAVSTTFSTILMSTYDTIYYRDIRTITDLIGYIVEFNFGKFYNELVLRWVLTPHNFIVFNTNTDNLAKFGLHLPYTHMLVNLPFAFNILGLLFYGKIYDLLVGSGVYRLIFSSHRVYALMLLSTLTSIILLSFNPHQEFRFLLPLIVLLAYAFSFRIYTSTKLLTCWFIINISLVYFYSSVHQAGVIKACIDLNPILNSYKSDNKQIRVNVIAFNCYLVPSYQWNIQDEDQRFKFDLHDTFNNFNSSLISKMSRVVDEQREHLHKLNHLYIMLPKLYENQLSTYLKNDLSIDLSRLQQIKHYSLHFSGEEFMESLSYVRRYGIREWRNALGFSLMKVDLSSLVSD